MSNLKVDQAVKDAAQQGRTRAARVGGFEANVDGVRAYQTNKGVRFVARAIVNGKAITKGGFETRKEGASWKAAQERQGAEIVKSDAARVPEALTLPQLFAEYEKLSEKHGKPLPKAQILMFRRLSRHHALVNVRVSEISNAVVHAYCSARKVTDEVKPATILTEFVRINVALRRVGRWLKWERFNPLNGCREGLVEDGLISESEERSRRPTAEEKAKLRGLFSMADYKARFDLAIPMDDIFEVAVQNGFRRGEIVDLRWSDLSTAATWAWRKDASQKTGERPGKRRCLVPLIGTVREILERQPRIAGEDRIFPFQADTISKRFADACIELGINTEDTPDSQALCFHDLRHEAISVFAQFVTTADAKMISGHKSDRSFTRYVNHGQEDAVRISGTVTPGLLKVLRASRA